MESGGQQETMLSSTTWSRIGMHRNLLSSLFSYHIAGHVHYHHEPHKLEMNKALQSAMCCLLWMDLIDSCPHR